MAAPEARTVLVRGLPAGATAALLERLFGHLGPLRRCFVVTEKGSPRCRGFGYVTFSLPEDAARALREPPELGGRALPVSPARPRARPPARAAGTPGESPPAAPPARRARRPSRKARLILRNLSFQCSEEELRALFAPFGPVLELNLPRKPDGTPRGFAFVQLQNLRQAAAALGGLNGAQLKGRPLAVDWAVAKDKYQGTQGPPKTPEGKEKGGAKKEEEEEEEGEEEDEGKEEEDEDEEDEEEEEEEAARAPRQSPKRGSGARAGLGHRKKRKLEEAEEEEEKEKEEQEEDEEKDEDEDEEKDEDEDEEDEDEEDDDEEDEEEEPPRRRRQRPSDVAEGRTVFIRNLSFDTEEEELEESLQQFGALHYVRLVLHPSTGTPKGSAFAQFETPEGAQKCIQAAQEGPEGGGLRLGGRLLRVDPALSREQARGLAGGTGGARPRGGTRNLYLAREGAIRPGSRAAEGVSDSDMAKRARFEELKRRRLQDPNVAVSRTRLCLHNLPKALDSARLRSLLRARLRGHRGAGPRIRECRVMRELRGQGKSLGFAFVEFGEHEEALGALRRLNNNPDLFGASKRPIVEFALEDRRKLRLREQRIQRGLLKAKAKAAAGAPEGPQGAPDAPKAQPAPPKGHPAPPKAQPEPPKGHPAPPKGHPAPPKGHPAPPKAQPAPPKGHPAPPKGHPAPPKGHPAPTKGHPAPPKGHPAPPRAQPAPPRAQPAPPRAQPAPPGAPQPPPGTPWAGFRTQGPGRRGAAGTKVLALPSHRGPKIRKRDKGKKAPPPPKPPKAPKASRRREKLRAPPPQGQRRRRGGPGGAEARFQELVERYKRKILGSSPSPSARAGKWFES